jgi:hypothetical protein
LTAADAKKKGDAPALIAALPELAGERESSQNIDPSRYGERYRNDQPTVRIKE